MSDNLAQLEEIRDQLKKVPDLERLSRRLDVGRITLKELMQIYCFILELEDMQTSLGDVEGPHQALIEKKFIDVVKRLNGELNQFACLIMNVVDMDDPNCVRDPHVKSTFDAELHRLDNEKKEVLQKLNQILEKVRDDLGLNKEVSMM